MERVPFFHGSGYAPEAVEGLTIGEVLAGADMSAEVTKVPVFAEFNGERVAIPGRVACQRQDTGQVVGVVTPRYEVIQNAAAFGWMAELGDDVQIERAGLAREGSYAWVLGRINREINVGGMDSEEIIPYLLALNSFDGTTSLMARFMPMRLVCKNGLMAAVKGLTHAIRIRHTKGAGVKFEEAQRILAGAGEYLDGFEELGNRLLGRKVTDAAWTEFIENLIPLPLDANPDQDRAARNKVEARNAITAIFRNGDNLANVRGTAWAAYNAVAEYSDHGRVFRSSNGQGDEDSRMENRFLSIVTDTRLKDRALELLSAS